MGTVEWKANKPLSFRASLGDPFPLEDLFGTTSKPKIYVMHAGYPMQNRSALMGAHAYVYVDIPE